MNLTAGQILIRKGNKIKPLKVFSGRYEELPKFWHVVGFSLDGSINYIVTEGEVILGATLSDTLMQHIQKMLPKIKFV